ncbi:SCY1-like protein 2 [Halotydeus destructor]|nr:SCY1-like protein 2 [Halotydeus destructor]
MESFVNKLRNTVAGTVSSTVSNLNSILPGNSLTREFEVSDHICSAGPGLLWKIYAAVKKSTKEEASLFLFEKRLLDKYSKREREVIIELLKKGVAQLTRLRHPGILTVQHPLEESRDSLAFATEPVSASLANVLGSHDNLPSPTPSHIKDHTFFDVEIKYGLLSISEALAFLHNDVKMLHRNLSPESIIISKKGCWKLAGFDFSVNPINVNDFPLYFPFLDLCNLSSSHPALGLPNPDFVAPEYISQSSSTEAKLSLSSDMYSLGALTYTLYNKGQPFLPTGGALSALTSRRIEQIERLQNQNLDCIPDDSRHHVKLLIHSDHTLRPDAHQFSKLAIFEDVLVRTLQYLDSLYQWDNLQKSKFYKGLPEIMSQMPLRVKLNRVIPCLAKEFMNPDMVPFVLPNVLIISEEATNEDFEANILKDLIPVFQMKEPIQISMILMQNMELILKKSKNQPESIKTHILPMMCRCLEVDAHQVQELCLNTIPSVAHLIDFPSLKNAVLPKIKKLCISTGLLSVRVNCLISVGKILEFLDKWLVLDDVIPFLPEIPSKEPAVIMASVGIIQMTMTSSKLGLTKEVIATKVVPFLMPLAIENGLTVEQFNTIMTLLREVVKRVEDEQRVKLEQLNSMKEQHSFAVIKYESKMQSPANIVGDDIFGVKPVSLPSASSFAGSSVTAANTKNVSLQEKERLAKEKAQQNTFKSEHPLIAAQPVARNTMHFSQAQAVQPKDLTSSLINSNLMNLSFGTPTHASQPPHVTSVTGLTSNGLPLMANQQAVPQVPTAFSQSHFNNGMRKPVPNNFSLTQGQLMQQAFQPRPQSMMAGPMPSGQPLSGYSQPRNTATATPLSKSDLEEFLK